MSGRRYRGRAAVTILACGTAVGGCVAGSSSSNIEQSTFGPRGSGGPAEYEILVNSAVAGTQDLKALEKIARGYADKHCPSGFLLRTEKYTDRNLWYDGRGGTVPTWMLEWTIQCTADPRGTVQGAGAQRVAALAARYSGDNPFFDTHGVTLAAPFDQSFRAAQAVLTARGHKVWETNERQGTIITASTKFGVVGPEYYDQYFIAFERLPNGQTRMTFKLFSHWRDYEEDGPPLMKPHTREKVYGRAAAFIDAVQAAVAKR